MAGWMGRQMVGRMDVGVYVGRAVGREVGKAVG
jgi:hypothetical protein